MQEYFDQFLHYYLKASSDLIDKVLHPAWNNFFYWVVGLTLFFWLLELIFPWRKQFPVFHKEFKLNVFYLFFLLFLFPIFFYTPISYVGVTLLNKFLGLFHVKNLVSETVQSWPAWGRIIVVFLVIDFFKWFSHILYHRIPFLWKFHKLHHSSETMGIGSGFRAHWMAVIIDGTALYIPLTILGFGLQSFFIGGVISIGIGTYSHSNIKTNIGVLKYIFNNPEMHLWHHARKKELPKGVHSVNYANVLSLWDYLFGTAYIPYDGKDIQIGFDGLENYPKTFIGQSIEPFIGKKKSQ